MEKNKEKFIKETDKVVEDLKNQFVKNYAIKNGWSLDNLSSEQLNEITKQDGYKNAGLLLS